MESRLAFGIACFLLLTLEVSSTVIDLTHIYGPDVLYPPVGVGLFNFTIMHRGYEPSLDHWLEINNFRVFEHGSTHIDAPAHYAQGRAHLHEIPPEQMIGPGVMIDITAKAKQDPDYLLTVQDILDWEKEHGDIPHDSIVMLNGGKHQLYPDRKLFYGTDTPDDTSTYHNPGVHPDTAKWLMQNRRIKAFGTDSHSCDPGQNNNRNPCHEVFLPNGVVLLEFVANLDRMPPTGSKIMYAPIKMRDGSGGPCRILAIYGEDDDNISKSPALSASFLSIITIFVTLVFNH